MVLHKDDMIHTQLLDLKFDFATVRTMGWKEDLYKIYFQCVYDSLPTKIDFQNHPGIPQSQPPRQTSTRIYCRHQCSIVICQRIVCELVCVFFLN